MTNLIELKLDGDLEQVVWATLTEQENNLPPREVTGKLPPNPNLATKFKQWESNYRSLGKDTRLEGYQISKDVKFMSVKQRRDNCKKSTDDCCNVLNQWLLLKSFRPIRETIIQKLSLSDEVRVLIRTSSQSLLKLPWHRQLG